MKFINLLKKEISELMNAQMILSMVAIVLIFMIMGGVMSDTISDAVSEATHPKISISDRDNTEFTGDLIESLKDAGAEVTVFDTEGDDYADILSSNNIKNIVIIPKGFTESLENNEAPELISVSRMTSTAAMSNISSGNSSAISFIQNCIADKIAVDSGLSEQEIALMENPVKVFDNTVVDDKSAEISVDSISNNIMMKNMFLPIIVFILIMMTSQSLMSAISNEKIDKTLETLLSAPVSRTAVLGAKMLAAALIALLNAAVYMFAFSHFMSGATDTISDETASGLVESYLSVDDALAQLGLSLNVMDYVLVGLQLFFTILICLSISLILGALVNDTKSSQTMIMPIMMLAMVPYIISMLADINSLPIVFRVLVYAIPFTHTFSAIPNLMFGNMTIFFGGLIYQIVAFAICMFFALRLFKSDKILTISLNFGQRNKFKKKQKNDE